MLFFYLSLSFFLGFSLPLFLIDLLSKFLEEHFQVNIVSRDRCQQLFSQSLSLIANVSDLLGELLINFSHLNFNLIPYIMVQSLQFLIVLANLEFCHLIKFFNNIFGLILELLIDLLFKDL